MARRVTVEFVGKDRSAGKTATDVEKKFGKLGGRLDKVGRVAGKALAGGLVVAAGGMYKLGQAAAADEAGQVRLATALRNSAGATDSQVASTEDWITAQGKALGVADDELRPALGKLVAVTHDVGKAQELAALAMDISAGSGKSLDSVTQALVKAQNGSLGGLSRLGVATKDANGKTKSLQQVTSELADTYKGQAAKAADTTAGKQRRLGVALSELGESIGAVVLPAMVKLSEVGMQAVSWIDRNRTTTAVLVGVLGGFAAVLWTVSAAMRVYIAVTKAWKVIAIVARNAQFALNVAMATNPIGLVIVALVALGAVLVLAYKKSTTFRKIVDAAFRGVQRAAAFAFGWVKKNWPLLIAILTGPIGIAALIIIRKWGAIKAGASNMVDWIRAIPGKLRALGGLFSGAGHALIQSFVNGMKNAGGIISGIAGNVWSAVKGLLNGAIDRLNSALSFTIPIPGPDVHVSAGHIPHLARGTTSAAGGTTLVGEEGPELLNLRRGAQVLSNRRTRALLGGGTGQPLLIQFLLDGRVVEQALVKRQRDTGRPIQIRVAST